jgi:hypothetical protein
VINGSAVTVTATAGMILAGLVLQDVYARFDHPPHAGTGPLSRAEAGAELHAHG